MGAVKELRLGEKAQEAIERTKQQVELKKQRQSIKGRYTKEQINLIRHTVAQGATDNELMLFLYQAKRKGLDPLSNQIHFVKRNTKNGPMVAIQTGIDGYRAIAHRTGLLAGVNDAYFDDGKTEYEMKKANIEHPETATVIVKKRVGNQIVESSATAGWDEYYPGGKGDFMWRKMPYLMLAKCAEALALRKAFPDDLSGIYTDAEMDQAQEDFNRELTEEEKTLVRDLIAGKEFTDNERAKAEEQMQESFSDPVAWIEKIKAAQSDRQAMLEEEKKEAEQLSID